MMAVDGGENSVCKDDCVQKVQQRALDGAVAVEVWWLVPLAERKSCTGAVGEKLSLSQLQSWVMRRE
jgi:hypothetical protein